MATASSYYQLLGLSATATDAEIRRAYLRLSLQFHPDKRYMLPDPISGDEVFQLIQEAYETLSCPEKRCLYDFFGAFAALADAIPDAAGCPPGSRGSSPPWSSSSGGPPASWFPPSAPSASRFSPSPSLDTCASSSLHNASGTAGHGPCGVHGAGPHHASGGSAAIASSRLLSQLRSDAGGPLGAGHQQPQPRLPGTAVQRSTPSPLFVDISGTCRTAPAPSPTPNPILGPGVVLGKRRAPGVDLPSFPSVPEPDPHAPAQPPPPPPAIPPLIHVASLSPPAAARPGAAGSACSHTPPPTAPASPTAPAVASAPSCASASADVTHRLWLTLEEMYSGCVKQLRLARRVCRAPDSPSATTAGPPWTACPLLSPPPQSEAPLALIAVEELFRVAVQPGWCAGMKVTFAGKGNELPGRSAGDMVLLVGQAAHASFERRGHDLHTSMAVPLITALTGGSAELTTLDGRTLTLALGPTCLQPGSERVLAGEGMPIMQGRARPREQAGGGGAAPCRGNLHVRFAVVFPEDLTAAQKEELRDVLLG